MPRPTLGAWPSDPRSWLVEGGGGQTTVPVIDGPGMAPPPSFTDVSLCLPTAVEIVYEV